MAHARDPLTHGPLTTAIPCQQGTEINNAINFICIREGDMIDWMIVCRVLSLQSETANHRLTP
jgi:hypothetical protein